MARPKKTPDERRDLRVAFRLTASDALAIEARAKAAGVSVSQYARDMSLNGRVAIVERPGLDFDTLDQLRRIGVNLNQLTREYHRRGHHDSDYLRDLCGQIEAVIGDAISQEISS